MNTDQQILELVKTRKFTLPEWLEYVDRPEAYDHLASWRLDFKAVTDQQAHDLCACHFARQLTHGRNNARMLGILGTALDLFREWVGKGDSAAAIAALHEAVCGKDAP